MDAQHTPKPWRVEWDHSWQREVIVADDGQWIATIGESAIYTGDSKANARLIAAAPDLLEACRAVLSCCPDWDATVKMVKAAIAKADGVKT